jgi:hypothetical protein
MWASKPGPQNLGRKSNNKANHPMNRIIALQANLLAAPHAADAWWTEDPVCLIILLRSPSLTPTN